MLTYDQLVGNQENWANFITNVEMRPYPFLDWLPVGDKPVNVLYQYQAEKYRDPVDNSAVDGKPWQSFQTVGEGRGVLKSLIQFSQKQWAISKISEDVSNIAGIDDQFAYEIPKQLKELSGDIEASSLDGHDCREDNGAVGYRSRAVASWVSSSAQSLYPVPSDFLTPAASISTTATGSLTENTIRDVLQSIGSTTKTNEAITAFVGPSLKRQFADFPLFVPSTASTGATGIVAQKQGIKEWERVCERYTTDFGPVDLNLSWYNHYLTGNTTTKNYSGFFLHRSRWEMRWNQKPKVYKLPFRGGSYEGAADCIWMLVCKNPKGEGRYTPTA